MSDPDWQDDEEISLFSMGTTFVRNRWRIVRWMLIGGVFAALLVASTPALYSATASFIPQGADAGRSNLATIAGQFGVAVPAANPSASPEFYSRLLGSRTLLLPIVRDSLVMPEMGGRRIAVLDLFEVPGDSRERREEQGVALLQGLVEVSVTKTTGVMELSVGTKWRSASLAIVTKLVDGISEYNQGVRQSQAAAERKFIEGRLALAGGDLRAAEERLKHFLSTNKNLGGSPELSIERDRILRDVSLRQQVFTTLTQAYEEARIREVRDTPVLMIVEPPSVPTLPQPRGRIRSVQLGLFFGALLGAFFALASGIISRRRRVGDPDAEEFFVSLREVRSEVIRRFPWLTKVTRK